MQDKDNTLYQGDGEKERRKTLTVVNKKTFKGESERKILQKQSEKEQQVRWRARKSDSLLSARHLAEQFRSYSLKFEVSKQNNVVSAIQKQLFRCNFTVNSSRKLKV